ncbi:MAG: hypothetical protein H7Y01_15575 [Ferruginibacter sp.]|nr:hypothetical protein [Chitinophagaceae bacterium]
MKTQLLFLSILIGFSSLWAQDSTFVTIKSGSSIRDVLTTTDILLSPQFITGKVFFRNGTKTFAIMNYNSLDDQMLFIDPNGDTLALKDEKTVKFITLDKDTFYYDEGYIRLVASNSVVKLAEKQVWEVADIRKIGSHNRPSTTFAITSYSTVSDRFGKSHDLLLNEDMVLRKKATYYFADMYSHFVPAGKKNLLLLFPKEQNSLANYLKVNKVNFNKKDDLEKVAQFLGQNY